MKHYFVDTNVIIDMLADREGYADAAADLFDAAGRGEICIYISSLSYSNVYYIIRKYLGHDRTIESLKALCEYVTIVPVTEKVIHLALASDFKDFEDAIQYFSAIQKTSIECIITRNIKDFKPSELPVIEPKAYKANQANPQRKS